MTPKISNLPENNDRVIYTKELRYIYAKELR
jgi:hypothetical protein